MMRTLLVILTMAIMTSELCFAGFLEKLNEGRSASDTSPQNTFTSENNRFIITIKDGAMVSMAYGVSGYVAGNGSIMNTFWIKHRGAKLLFQQQNLGEADFYYTNHVWPVCLRMMQVYNVMPSRYNLVISMAKLATNTDQEVTITDTEIKIVSKANGYFELGCSLEAK
jgi:hypothetical protein